MPRLRALALLSLTGLVALSGTTTATTGPAIGADRVAYAGAHSPAYSTRAEHPSRAAHRIDTSSRAAVVRAWTTRMLPNLSVASGWNGSVDGCVPGAPSAAAQAATLQSLNFVRALAGLSEVGFSADLSAQAQQAALMMAANQTLDHTPPSSWACWTAVGAGAAGRSNLASASPQLTAGGVVEQYMDDAGTGNEAAGHRRWILNPATTTYGSGATETTNDLYVFGPTSATARNPRWVSWPTAGFFPQDLEPGGRWSLSSGRAGADFSAARVSVRRGATRLGVSTYPVQNGYAMPTLVFEVRGAIVPGSYQVRVSGIRGAGKAVTRYRVRIFD